MSPRPAGNAAEVIERKPEDDQILVDRILGGDEEAFTLLVERYSDRTFRLVRGIVGDWHRSEDVLQEVFVLVYRKLNTFDRRSAFTTWLYRVAVNAALKARGRHRNQRLQVLDEGFDQEQKASVASQRLELSELAEKLLRCLPAHLRAVILLREWEGLSYDEIGQVLSCSRGAVEQRLHRAMVELRRIWKPLGKEEWLHGL